MDSISSLLESPRLQLVIFRLEKHTYAIKLESIREIITFRHATRLPGAPLHVAGLVNVRGTIVTVVDLGQRFEGRPSASEGAPVLLVDHAAKVIGLAVHEAIEARTVDADALDPSAAEASEAAVSALTLLDGEVVLVVDIDAVLSGVLL
ncbi:MAG: chemotaxis protein CheW [Gemmatimonadaceae bacterium]